MFSILFYFRPELSRVPPPELGAGFIAIALAFPAIPTIPIIIYATITIIFSFIKIPLNVLIDLFT